MTLFGAFLIGITAAMAGMYFHRVCNSLEDVIINKISTGAWVIFRIIMLGVVGYGLYLPFKHFGTSVGITYAMGFMVDIVLDGG